LSIAAAPKQYAPMETRNTAVAADSNPMEVNDFTASLRVVRPKVSVRNFYEKAKDDLLLEVRAGSLGLDALIEEKSLNRPALALTRYFKHFANKRLQVFGIGEMDFLGDKPAAEQTEVLEEIMAKKIPGILVSRDKPPSQILMDVANLHNVPVLYSRIESRELFPKAIIRLEQLFAPRVTLHATFVDVRGIGVLLLGPSGIGKSECALALLARGHALVADDFVIVELRDDHNLCGFARESGHAHMECRGVGIIDVGAIFGARAVARQKSVDMLVEFRKWEEGVEEDRTGTEKRCASILGQRIPHFILHVRPGRDTARLVELAAMVHALKQMGYDCAEEFNKKLIKKMESAQTPS
jgi:HPr kinase/phosphorylase